MIPYILHYELLMLTVNGEFRYVVLTKLDSPCDMSKKLLLLHRGMKLVTVLQFVALNIFRYSEPLQKCLVAAMVTILLSAKTELCIVHHIVV